VAKNKSWRKRNIKRIKAYTKRCIELVKMVDTFFLVLEFTAKMEARELIDPEVYKESVSATMEKLDNYQKETEELLKAVLADIEEAKAKLK